MFLAIIFIFILLIIAALTAASEIAIISVSRIRMRKLASSGSKSASIVLKMLDAPEKFFSTILVANNVVGTMVAAIVTVIMIAAVGNHNEGILLATITASLILIVFEVVAKTLAATHSEKLSLVLAKPVNTLILISSPIVKGLVFITNFILRLVSVQMPAKPALVTEE